MPARRLHQGPVDVSPYDVLGLDVPDVPSFIGHVCLAAEARVGLSADDQLRVTDMQPPMVQARGPVQVHAHGIVPLTPREAGVIQEFIDRTENEYQSTNLGGFHQYAVLPHCVCVTDENGMVVARKYSCGGFVLEAYRFAGIDLLDTEGTSLPPVSLEILHQAYSHELQRHVLDTPRLRERFLGLTGDGPWPIVLPGYLLNALSRIETEIRAGTYRARPGDEYFPAAVAGP